MFSFYCKNTSFPAWYTMLNWNVWLCIFQGNWRGWNISLENLWIWFSNNASCVPWNSKSSKLLYAMYYDNVLFFLLCFVMAFWLTVVLHCVMLCFVVLCCGVLCCVVLSFIPLYCIAFCALPSSTVLNIWKSINVYVALKYFSLLIAAYCSSSSGLARLYTIHNTIPTLQWSAKNTCYDMRKKLGWCREFGTRISG